MKHDESSTWEQNKAAGGQERRIVKLPSGRIAMGSVQLLANNRSPSPTALFRFRTWGGTQTISLGPVKGNDRTSRLKEAWKLVHARNLLDGGGLRK
jgi:DNA mismatch endonuclease (patch repair protein)